MFGPLQGPGQHGLGGVRRRQYSGARLPAGAYRASQSPERGGPLRLRWRLCKKKNQQCPFVGRF